jgi:hypothetical protein
VIDEVFRVQCSGIRTILRYRIQKLYKKPKEVKRHYDARHSLLEYPMPFSRTF